MANAATYMLLRVTVVSSESTFASRDASGLIRASPAGGVEDPDTDINQAKRSTRQGAVFIDLTEAISACVSEAPDGVFRSQPAFAIDGKRRKPSHWHATTPG